jgi:hypothetical protein
MGLRKKKGKKEKGKKRRKKEEKREERGRAISFQVKIANYNNNKNYVFLLFFNLS